MLKYLIEKEFKQIMRNSFLPKLVIMFPIVLDFPDSYMVTLEHESGHRGQLVVDVVTRVPVRQFEVFGEQLQIEWRGKPEDLYIADDTFSMMQKVELKQKAERQDGYQAFVVENAYREEIQEFFAVCDGKAQSRYSFTKDMEVVRLIDQLEGWSK